MKIDLLLHQTADAYLWVNKLLESIPYKKWEVAPPILETHVLWQTGHLIVSFYYHSMLVIAGHQSEIMQTMPLRLYSQLFTQGSPSQAIDKVDPHQLYADLKTVQEKSLDIISKLKEDELEKVLEPTGYPHPVAKIKFEALDWNIKHTLWHCGQLGLLKRVVDQRYDFNLQAG